MGVLLELLRNWLNFAKCWTTIMNPKRNDFHMISDFPPTVTISSLPFWVDFSKSSKRRRDIRKHRKQRVWYFCYSNYTIPVISGVFEIPVATVAIFSLPPATFLRPFWMHFWNKAPLFSLCDPRLKNKEMEFVIGRHRMSLYIGFIISVHWSVLSTAIQRYYYV